MWSDERLYAAHRANCRDGHERVYHFAEDRAWLCRRAIGLKGAVDPRAVWALVEWLGEGVEVRQFLGAKPTCTCGPPGRVRIRAPLCLGDERREALAVLHEVGHWLAYEGAVPTRNRRLRTCTVAAEAEADRFAEAFLLPPQVAQELRCQDDAESVMELTTLSVEAVARRIEETRGWERPREPPTWSAWHQILVERVSTPLINELLLIDRRSTWRALVPGNTDGLPKDLVALRPAEFRAKYERHQPRSRGVTGYWAQLMDQVTGISRAE